MHKLGAALGVKAMSLYNHVANKSDVVDRVLELLWTEVEEAAPTAPDWQDGVRSFAGATRDMILRHRNATLIASPSFMPQAALRVGPHARGGHGRPRVS